jgi:hypothetical protein
MTTVTSSFRVSVPRVSSAYAPTGISFGADAARAELHAMISGQSQLQPAECRDTRYFRYQLDGTKPMPIGLFDICLKRLQRLGYREAIRAIFDRWLVHFGMHAVDIPTVADVKDVSVELLEASVSAADAIATVGHASVDGIDPREQRECTAKIDVAIGELRDLRKAVSR